MSVWNLTKDYILSYSNLWKTDAARLQTNESNLLSCTRTEYYERALGHWCMWAHKANTYQALLTVKPWNLSFSIMVKKMSKESWHSASMCKCEASASHFIISFMFPISIGRGAQPDYKGTRVLSEKLLHTHYVWVTPPTRVYLSF